MKITAKTQKREYVFTKLFNKIALNANDDKII